MMHNVEITGSEAKYAEIEYLLGESAHMIKQQAIEIKLLVAKNQALWNELEQNKKRFLDGKTDNRVGS
jgi:hypothetical protein